MAWIEHDYVDTDALIAAVTAQLHDGANAAASRWSVPDPAMRVYSRYAACEIGRAHV